MGNFWTVKPEVDEVEFTVDGRTGKLWLKRELTVGEQRNVDTGGFKSVSGLGGGKDSNPALAVDWKAQTFARTLAYVNDWDLADDANNKLKINADTLASLRQDVYEAIESAITGHVERRAEAKKSAAGETSQPAISA